LPQTACGTHPVAGGGIIEKKAKMDKVHPDGTANIEESLQRKIICEGEGLLSRICNREI
jgi:hypothetical protein